MVAWTIFRSKWRFGKLVQGICRAGLPEPKCENTFLHDWEQSGEYQAAIFGFRIFGREILPHVDGVDPINEPHRAEG